MLSLPSVQTDRLAGTDLWSMLPGASVRGKPETDRVSRRHHTSTASTALSLHFMLPAVDCCSMGTSSGQCSG